jgi:hypothetical protein
LQPPLAALRYGGRLYPCRPDAMLEYTVYTRRPEPLTTDEVAERLARFGLNSAIVNDSEDGARSSHWFISLMSESPEREDDTMPGEQMVVLDVNSDERLVRGAAASLRMSMREAIAADESTEQIDMVLGNPRQSFFCSVNRELSSGIKILQIAALIACMDVGDGVLFDDTSDVLVTPQTLKSFLKRELGGEADLILGAMS